MAKFQLILLLEWQSHSVSRQRIPEFRTVFCSQRILFPGIPFQTLRKGWPLHQGLHKLLSNYLLPVKYRILWTSSRIAHCILLRSRIPCLGCLADKSCCCTTGVIGVTQAGFGEQTWVQDKRAGGKEKNNACRQVIVLSLPNVHLGNAGFYWLREAIFLSFPSSLLSNASYWRLKTRLSTPITPVQQLTNK